MPGMSPRLLACLALVCALVLPPAALAARRPLTINTFATRTSDQRSGKTVTFREALRAPTGKLVGHNVVSCTSTSASAARCKATYTLAKGTLKVAGTVRSSRPESVLQVKSGTGAYKGRTGTIVLLFRSSTQAQETINLR
jgi:hypothetical protein